MPLHPASFILAARQQLPDPASSIQQPVLEALQQPSQSRLEAQQPGLEDQPPGLEAPQQLQAMQAGGHPLPRDTASSRPAIASSENPSALPQCHGSEPPSRPQVKRPQVALAPQAPGPPALGPPPAVGPPALASQALCAAPQPKVSAWPPMRHIVAEAINEALLSKLIEEVLPAQQISKVELLFSCRGL